MILWHHLSAYEGRHILFPTGLASLTNWQTGNSRVCRKTKT